MIDKDKVPMKYSWETLSLQFSPMRNTSEGMVSGSMELSIWNMLFSPGLKSKVL